MFIETVNRDATKKYPTVYKNGPRGYSVHPQVDTGLGFTCDEKIAPVVLAFNKVGIETLGSCQDIGTWAHKRMGLTFKTNNPYQLLGFCLFLKKEMEKQSGWHQTITCDGYFRESHKKMSKPFGTISFIYRLEAMLITTVQKWGKKNGLFHT